MLVMFSVMMLTELPRDSQDSYIGPLEWIVCFLMFTWIIHEAVQIGSTCLGTNRGTKFQASYVVIFSPMFIHFVSTHVNEIVCRAPQISFLFPVIIASFAIKKCICCVPAVYELGKM